LVIFYPPDAVGFFSRVTPAPSVIPAHAGIYLVSRRKLRHMDPGLRGMTAKLDDDSAG
jgi:hypothetical protein